MEECPIVEGTIVIMDLDDFGELVKREGLSEYSPNRISGLLSNLVEEFVRKWSAVVVYGLDWNRGTEEVVIEIPLVKPEELREDLLRIHSEINREGGKISIVALRSPVSCRVARNRREAYEEYRKKAHRVLLRIKRRGGNIVHIEE